MSFVKKKSLNIKTSKPCIKNPLGYVFYNFDKILRKNNFCRFGPKMSPKKLIYKKSSNLGLLLISKGYKRM
jgi:hypothetical protein